MFEATGCFINIAHVEKLVFFLTEEKTQRGIRKRELDELRKQCIQEKRYCVIEMYECDCWNMYKTDKIVGQHLRASFPYKMPFREKSLLENIKSGSLFGYVQCDFEVTENLREAFTSFPPMFKNINCRDDVDPLMKDYNGKEGISTQSRRVLRSSFFLEQSLHRCSSFIWTWSWFARKIIALWNTLRSSASTILFSLQ